MSCEKSRFLLHQTLFTPRATFGNSGTPRILKSKILAGFSLTILDISKPLLSPGIATVGWSNTTKKLDQERRRTRNLTEEGKPRKSETTTTAHREGTGNMMHASKATAGLMTLLLFSLATTDGRPVNSGVESPLLQDKVAAVAVDNKVILTQTSCGYLEFAVNWITHMEALGIKNWLTIAEDETAMRFLEQRYPGHAIPASAFTNEALSSGNALYEWGSAAFTKVACARPTYLQLVLDLGYEVLWSDMDAVWLKDFFHLAPQGLDYVGVDDSEVENEQETPNACTGLMYFRPTVRTQQLLSDWHGMCMELNQNNQGAFNRVFGGADQHRQLDYYIMPKALYPHGALIELVDYRPEQGAAGGLDPAWIHANYRVGHSAKREFLRDRMVWRADEFIKNYAIPTCPVSQDGVMVPEIGSKEPQPTGDPQQAPQVPIESAA